MTSPSEEIQQKTGAFIDGCIDSVETLSVLLLLHSTPTRIWSIDEITKELRSTPSSINIRMNELYKRKVIKHSSDDSAKHQYQPYSEEIGETVDLLAQIYRTKPLRVIERIYSRPSRMIAEFAEAFRIRKED